MSADQVGADQLNTLLLKRQQSRRVGRLPPQGRRADRGEETPGLERWTPAPSGRRAIFTLEPLEVPAPLLGDRGPITKELTIPCCTDDISRSAYGVIAPSDDHHRPADVMKYSLRDASQEKAAECPESSGSENDEVDVAAVRGLHDFPRRVALRNQSRDRTSSLRE